MPFPCLQEPENMIPNQITEYMDGLPPLTQYCDLRGLYNLLPQDARDWKDYVIQWQDVSPRQLWIIVVFADCASYEDVEQIMSTW